jgi:hypothetical protein
MPYEPPPELAALSLAEVADLAAARRLPPVEQWNPAVSGDSLMTILADGRWLHDGGEIRRPAMVRAFSSLLRRDADGQHWLVTPHERQSIKVEDAAFIAVDVARHGDALVFRLNMPICPRSTLPSVTAPRRGSTAPPGCNWSTLPMRT